EADHFYRLALAQIVEPTEHCKILERYADMLYRAGNHTDAAPLFQKLVERCDAAANDIVRWRSRYLDSCWSARSLSPNEMKAQLIELRDVAAASRDDDAYLVASRLLL